MKEVFLVIYITLGTCLVVNSLPDVIPIGGLFHPDDRSQEVAFRNAVEMINADRSILPRHKLLAQVERISPQDSFHATDRVCSLLNTGVAAIFGPQSPYTASHVQSICDTMEVPHLETRWDYRLRRESCQINLYPHPGTLSKAYVELVRALGWTSVTIVYEDNDGLARLQELLKAQHSGHLSITLRQLSKDEDNRSLFKQIKSSGESNIVLDCSTDRIYDVLNQAQQIGLMSDYHSYLITSLDLNTVDLEEFKFVGANIIAFRMVDPEQPELQAAVGEWSQNETSEYETYYNSTGVKTETALMYDAVLLFANALNDLDTSQQIVIQPLSCDSQDTWPHGYSLINYMKIVEIRGLTGVIKFDHEGFRSDFFLDVIEFGEDGLRSVGIWNSTHGVNLERSDRKTKNEIVGNLQNKTMIVTAILVSPYVMLRDSAEKLSGNDRFDGYSVDLIQEVSRILGIQFSIQLAPDGRYGSVNQAGEWDGMIGELIDGRADLAIADLTITSAREQAIDFSLPFMNLGISVLYKKPEVERTNWFFFLSPFTPDVWIYIAIAHVVVSMLLYVLARIHFRQEVIASEDQFTLLDSLWFTIGPFSNPRSTVPTKSLSTRMVTGAWWFFISILICTYVANLVTLLHVQRGESPIANVDDLARQTKVSYGVVQGGSTAAFFQHSNSPTYQRMWSFMESTRPSVFVRSVGEGIQRVLEANGEYAFLTESTAIEYITERQCELTEIGGWLDSKAFGIAMPLNSPYRTAINTAILHLQEEGTLLMLKRKWWTEKLGGGSCATYDSDSTATVSELGLANIGGLFVALSAGVGVACVVAAVEHIWKFRKGSK